MLTRGVLVKKGKIIFLNGVTSAGKTSIAEEIQELANEVYYHVSNDTFHCIFANLPPKFL